MRFKPVIPRVIAEDDLDRACDHYLVEAGPDIAEAFLIEFERVTNLISRSPGLGSPRSGFEYDLSGVRSWSMKKFPYMIFYIETDHSIDVWRVLHGKMDIPTVLVDPETVSG